MTRHILRIRYDGLLAATHEMDAAESRTVIEGAKNVLAALASFWTTGKVPDRLRTDTLQFNVRHTALRPGSCEYDFVVNILANGVWDLAKFGFALFVYEHFRAWRERHATTAIPEFARKEPVLEPIWGPNNRPVFNSSEGLDAQRQRLHDRMTNSMRQITIPLVRNATTAELSFDGRRLEAFTRRVPRRYSEADITAALDALRLRQAGATPRHQR